MVRQETSPERGSPERVSADRALPDRILDAALACIGRVGLAKTTLDDVARQAGCSRATVYRHFPGKAPLLVAAVDREADRLTESVLDAAAGERSVADAAVAVVTTGTRELVGSDALRFVVEHEPESLLPFISFERGDALLAEAARRLAPAFVRFVPAERALRLTEWLVRISLSYLCSPVEGSTFDEARVRTLVEDFVLPGLTQGVNQ